MDHSGSSDSHHAAARGNDIAEVARRKLCPAFDVVRAAHVELTVSDLAVSEEFYVDRLGLIVTERSDASLYLRGWEERLHHSIVLQAGEPPAASHLAFRVASSEDLELLERDFKERGCPVERISRGEPGQGPAVRVLDPFGFPLEFFCEMTRVPSQLQRFDLQRGAPILRFDHFNLHAPDLEPALRFWQELGFRCSEFIASDGDDEKVTGAWLSRKPGVHDVALTNGRGPRLHHIGCWVADTTAVIRACDQLAAAGLTESIERGPGRHGVSNAFFVYLRDPDGHRIELYTSDYYTGDPDHEPLRWSLSDPRCRSFWGARAPDSWYEESSVVLDLDGRPVETREPPVDERSVLLA